MRRLSAIVFGTLLLQFIAVLPANACVARDIKAGVCTSGTSAGNAVDIWAQLTERYEQSQQDGAGGGSTPTRALSADELARLRWWAALWERIFAEPSCASFGICESAPITSTVIAASTEVTLEDIASFVPATPESVSEPAGWALVNMPSNFVLRASQHVVDGTLLGLPAQVRFTPVAGHWRHADGPDVNASTLGATWVELGQEPWTQTATSHTFRASGWYTVTAFVEYSAEYLVGSGDWVPIDGTVTADAPPVSIQVFTAHTALVNHTCIEDPTGPGC